jgi:septal ring factor EnvC (AmiA/AmiB activator)
VAYRIQIDQPAEKSATNRTKLKERIENHLIVVLAGVLVFGITIGLKVVEYVQIAPRDREIASLKEQVTKLEADRDPDRKQINELSTTIQKLENSLAALQDSLKKSYNDNAVLQKRIKTYETNGAILLAIRGLAKEKSLVDKNLYPVRTNQTEGFMAREQTRHHEMQMYKSNQLQDRILSLQQKLGCEPK